MAMSTVHLNYVKQRFDIPRVLLVSDGRIARYKHLKRAGRQPRPLKFYILTYSIHMFSRSSTSLSVQKKQSVVFCVFCLSCGMLQAIKRNICTRRRQNPHVVRHEYTNLPHNFFEVWNLFSWFLWKLFSALFQVTFDHRLFISLALRKCKKDCRTSKIIQVPAFCPLKTEITRFPIGFRLKVLSQW